MMDNKKLVEILQAIAQRMEKEKEVLTELDNAIGDGDHGINLARGFAAVEQKLPTLADNDLGAILKGVGIYNEYYSANLYLQDKQKLGTVAISLYAFTGPQGSKYNLICAGVVITLLPALIALLLFQKQIYNGVAAGAVKE